MVKMSPKTPQRQHREAANQLRYAKLDAHRTVLDKRLGTPVATGAFVLARFDTVVENDRIQLWICRDSLLHCDFRSLWCFARRRPVGFRRMRDSWTSS